MKILSVEEANSIAAGNKLRMYPSVKRGRDRLFPFARPEIKSNKMIAENAKFFVAGNCFARSIEKALMIGGKNVISSPYNPDMPGDAVKQFQRYNIFNLDVATNEILWATQRPENVDEALVAVGDELVDMQLHFSVAYPDAEMRRIRRIYNSSYANISEADVILGVVGSTRQWYDSANGIYMNVQPTRRMTADYPGRFELHEFGVEDVENSLCRFHDAVRQSNKHALMLLMVSPVSQPSTFSAQDALISQYQSKCLQRTAVANFINEVDDDVEYVAALEAAYLSDFQYTFLESSPHHTKPNLGDRVTADLLKQCNDRSEGQQVIEAHGYGNALLMADEFEAAANLLEPLVLRDGPLLLERPSDMELHRIFVTALLRLGRDRDALDHLQLVFLDPRYASLLDGSWDDDDSGNDQIRTGRQSLTAAHQRPDHLFALARGPLFKVGRPADFDLLLKYAETRGHDTERLKFRDRSDSAVRDVMKGFIDLFQTGGFDEAIEMATELEQGDYDFGPNSRRQLDTLTLQAHVKTGRSGEGIERLLNRLADESTVPDKRTVTILCNIARSHANSTQIDLLIDVARRASIGEAAIEGLETRKQRLEGKRPAGRS